MRRPLWMERNHLNSLAPDYAEPAMDRLCECGAREAEHEQGDFVINGCARTGCEKFDAAKKSPEPGAGPDIEDDYYDAADQQFTNEFEESEV